MNAADQQRRLEQDPDFILLKRFDNSLEKLLERYPEGAPDKLVAKALGLEEDEVKVHFQKVVAKIQRLMCIR